MENTKVLVTGANGFIAGHTIIALLKKGYSVRGTLRKPDTAEAVRAVIGQEVTSLSNLELVYADLLDDASWAPAMEGCRFVLHLASPASLNLPKDPNETIKPAVNGALAVLHAALCSGVQRVVITSSGSVAQHSLERGPGEMRTEDDWTALEQVKGNPYFSSKILAEKAVWEFAKAHPELEVTTVLPGVVFGPTLEKDYGTSLVVIDKLLGGVYPGMPRLGWPLVDVRDVAEMLCLAMESEKAAGERLNCCNEFMWIEDIAKILAANFPEYRKKLPKIMLPDWAVRLVARFDPATRFVLFELGVKRELSNRKARELLSWSPRSNEEAIVSGAQSLIKYGVV